MPWIELPVLWTLVIDILAWAFFHMAISVFTSNLPASFFDKTAFIYHIREWENEGQFWQDCFRIKQFGKYIPDGSRLLRAGFNKQNLQETSSKYFEVFVLETKRAEFNHLISIFPAFLFFIWNPVWAGWVMVLYALLFNVPIIMLQRYNRPRFKKILCKKERRKSRR